MSENQQPNDIPDPVGELNKQAAQADAQAKTADESGLNEPDWTVEEKETGVNQEGEDEDGPEADLIDCIAESSDAAQDIAERLVVAGSTCGLYPAHHTDDLTDLDPIQIVYAIGNMAVGMFARMLANSWRGDPFALHAEAEGLRASLIGAAVKLNMRSSYQQPDQSFEQACDVCNRAMILAYNAANVEPGTLMVPLHPAVSAVPQAVQTGPGQTFMSQPAAARRAYVEAILQESLLALSGDEHAAIRTRINETRQALSRIGGM